MSGIYKSITIDSFSFMDPQFDKVVWLDNGFLFGLEHALENIGQVSNIELIMEVLSGLSELPLNLLLELKGTLDDWKDLLLDSSLEVAEVLVQVSEIDC